MAICTKGAPGRSAFLTSCTACYPTWNLCLSLHPKPSPAHREHLPACAPGSTRLSCHVSGLTPHRTQHHTGQQTWQLEVSSIMGRRNSLASAVIYMLLNTHKAETLWFLHTFPPALFASPQAAITNGSFTATQAMTWAPAWDSLS